MGQEKQLAIPKVAAQDAASFELLRVWVAQQAQQITLRPGIFWKVSIRRLSRCWRSLGMGMRRLGDWSSRPDAPQTESRTFPSSESLALCDVVPVQVCLLLPYPRDAQHR